MKHDNHFQFAKSQHLDQVMLLQAEIDDFSYSKHAHEEYSFGVTLAGRQDFFSSGAFHRSLPGNIIVFNPGEVHDGQAGTGDSLHYRMVYIHPDQLEPMLTTAGVKDSRDFQIADNLVKDPQLRQHILNMADLIEQSDNKLQQECELYQLAARVAQCYGQHSSDRVIRRADRLLLQARDYIHANLMSDMSLDEISQQASLSKYHFLRMFREYYGITPHQYILNCRINKAREALEQGSSLEDIVFDCGFSDLSHLNRRFKPVYGMTPRQYQQHFIST